MKSKIVIMVLSICVLLLSLGVYLESTSAQEIREKCEKFCKKYKDDFLNWACMDGCLTGATQK